MLAFAGVCAHLWWRLTATKARLDAVDGLIADCGLLKLGMDEASVEQVMGRPAARRPEGGDVILAFSSGFSKENPWVRLDSASGRVVEVGCSAAFHLEALSQQIQAWRQAKAAAVATDPQRP